jgi:hypothetical protein
MYHIIIYVSYYHLCIVSFMYHIIIYLSYYHLCIIFQLRLLFLYIFLIPVRTFRLPTLAFTLINTSCSFELPFAFWKLFEYRRYQIPRAQFSECSSTTNAHSETGQITVCGQNLTLGALSSRSALSVLVDALFKKLGLFLIRVFS